MYASRSDVVTATSARYAKQLVSHLGRHVAFESDEAGLVHTSSFDGAAVRIAVAEGSLVLTVEAGTLDALALGEHVLGSHLERFASRNPLTVSWVRSGAPFLEGSSS